MDDTETKRDPAPEDAPVSVVIVPPKLVPSPDSVAKTEKAGKPAEVVDAATPEKINLRAAEWYLNRELTWLAFNRRVLAEAQDRRTPLLERIRFLAIVGMTLDEFFMKRIGGLKQQVGANLQRKTSDGRTPQQQIAECYELIRDSEKQQRDLLGHLKKLLKKHDILLTTYDGLDAKEQKWAREHYFENIFPLCTPQAIDPAHPFPFISNLSLNLLVTLHYPSDDELALARVKVPIGAGIPRFLQIGTEAKFVPLEEVMANNLDLLFPGMVVDSCELFRVTRNANTERVEEQADDLMALIESELRDRKFAPIVRMEVQGEMNPMRRGMLAAELGLNEASDVFECQGMLGLSDLAELANLDWPRLKYTQHHALDHPRLMDDRPIFRIIREAPLLLFHPYESFSSSVERFLAEASLDPKVRAIKMTLYRTASDSKIIGYLLDAASNGKQVAVVVELKARFDEAANIRWANRLEEAGIHVTYGVVGLKTHCKCILVVRNDYDGLRRYAHISTGNYHEGTARVYSDIGLLTADPAIGKDLTELFNYLTTGYTPGRSYKKLLPAPHLLTRALLQRIDREIELHSEKSPGLIQFKTNALEDMDITRALYKASRAGVKVELIVRDSCRLRPGIAGLSENIRVISIVGRFLEHARIYYFRNGGEEEYLIGSADCMERNLKSRVEIITPVDDETLRAQIRRMLDLQINDTRGAWLMHSDGEYTRVEPESGDKPRGSQQSLIEITEKRFKQATRLNKRKPKGIGPRRPT